MFSLLLPRRRNAPKAKPSPAERIHLPELGLEFLFQRDGCRTLRLTVKPDGSVRVKAPATMSMEYVLAFVRSRLVWIKEKQDFFRQHSGKATEFREGGMLWHLGRPYTIHIVPPGKGIRARLTGSRLELPCRSSSSQDVEHAFKIWRTALARSILARRLARLQRFACVLLGDSCLPVSLTVRSLKRRWGSCSVRGEITLAVQLMALPLPLADYVILHELCHLRRMDHSPAFHALLSRLVPDAEAREKSLRIWSLEHPRV